MSEEVPASDGAPPLVSAEVTEQDLRRMLARELHDRVAQTLTSMLIDLENFKAEQIGRAGVLQHMDTLQESTREVLNSLRELLYDLRGGQDLEESFVDSVHSLLARFQEKVPIVAELAVLPGWPARVAAPAAVNLYRIIDEALSNVRWHSGAKAVRVTLQEDSEKAFSITIADDGRGLELEPAGPRGMGMVGMRERALFLGAELCVETVAGSGTTVRVIVPRERL